MIEKLKNLYIKIEQLKGKDLLVYLLKIFVVFLIVGFILGYVKYLVLNKNENKKQALNQTAEIKPTSYEGTVTFVSGNKYSTENIKYALTDKKGSEIILLKTSDKKLDLLEGLNVMVKGSLSKTSTDNKDVLFVTEVVMNASN
jgi:hypothetical protein